MTRSMPVGVESPGRASIGERTLRTDGWWRYPVSTFALLSLWVIYATVRAFMNHDYFVPQYHYLSPFTSPCISSSCVKGSTDFGTWFGNFPVFLPLAILTLVFLLGFRMTCYYYRKAYYRAFWRSPQACGVAEPHGKYTGETRFPLILQNAHRYFWMIAVLISLVNTYDAIRAFTGGNPNVDAGIGMGLGTVIMVVNVVALWLYTLGCHSCRHIIGGRLRHFSKHPVRYRAWTGVSWLNGKHGNFAWTSLGTLALTDFYILLVASGVFSDPRIFN